MLSGTEKKTVEEHLNLVDYDFIGYVPSDAALKFVHFIKAVTDGAGEENTTPPVHLVMMDRVFNNHRKCALMVFRGAAKTSLFAEFLILYIAAFGDMPGFGPINLMLYITDSIENGVKNLRRNVEYRYENSEFLQQVIPNKKIKLGTDGSGYVDIGNYEEAVDGGRKFTDIRLEFINNKGHRLVVKGYGAKALALDTKLYLKIEKDKPLYTTIGECKIGDEIYGPDGKTAKITAKSEIFNKPMYQINLEDGRSLKVSEDHINSVMIRLPQVGIHNKGRWVEQNLTVPEIFTHGMIKDGYCAIRIKNTAPLQCPSGNILVNYYQLGRRLAILNFSTSNIPDKLATIGDFEQRMKVLAGIMDFKGKVLENGRIELQGNSKEFKGIVSALIRSLGGTVYEIGDNHRLEVYLIRNPFIQSDEKNKFVSVTDEYWNSVCVVDIVKIPNEPSQCIAIDNKNHQFLAGEYFRTHNTGVRGAKEMGQRPTLAILDDLVSDEDARSSVVISSIENTIYKAVSKALHPKLQKMVFIGTPYNAGDPLYKAVESGAWTVSVFPICEKFPVSKDKFKGAWEDRFPYEYVKQEYEEAVALGKPEYFNQELMLRIISDEDRLVNKDDIVWYSRTNIITNKDAFNFYITTDFATNASKKADFSVILVWAYNNNGNWLLVDGMCKRQLMDANLEVLFRYVSIYKPLSVGIEVSGQQGAFIQWIQNEMIEKNVYFNLASSKNSNMAGIRPVNDKITRFNVVLPLFTQKKMWFPTELKDTALMNELLDELYNTSLSGIKSRHDDVIDAISQVVELKAYRPSQAVPKISYQNTGNSTWLEFEDEKETNLANHLTF